MIRIDLALWYMALNIYCPNKHKTTLVSHFFLVSDRQNKNLLFLLVKMV